MKKKADIISKSFLCRGLKKKSLRIFFAAGVLLLLFSSCQNSSERVAPPLEAVPDRILSLCITSDVSSLDPRYGIDGTSTQVVRMLFEGLMHTDLTGNILPAMASSYEMSEDKKTYIFHIRDCQWSNGMDVTAYDFEYSWKSSISFNQEYRSAAVHNFYVIQNVSKYLHGQCDLDSIGVRALDGKTLKVDLENPIPYFLEAVTNACFFPICKVVDQTRPNWAREKGRKFVCNGPFHLNDHQHDNEIVMEKNPLFWDAQHVFLQKINIQIVKDAMTRLCLFEKGKLDWIGKPLSGLPLDACAILKKEGKITVLPSLAVYWYFFNTERFPFTNKKMRQAFAYAINRKEITDYVLQFNETPATCLLPKAYGVVEEYFFQDNDKQKAQELFKEALAELGLESHNLPEISISYNSDEIHQNVAQIVQHQIYSTLGIKIKLKHTDWKVHYSNLVQGDYCIGGMTWQSWIRDPIYILRTFRSKHDGINMSRWENHLFQQVLDSADKEINLSTRKELLSVAQRIIMEEMPVIPVYFNSIAFAKSKDLQNISVLESSNLDFRHAYFANEPLGR